MNKNEINEVAKSQAEIISVMLGIIIMLTEQPGFDISHFKNKIKDKLETSSLSEVQRDSLNALLSNS